MARTSNTASLQRLARRIDELTDEVNEAYKNGDGTDLSAESRLLGRLMEARPYRSGLVEAWEIITGTQWTGREPITTRESDVPVILPPGVVLRVTDGVGLTVKRATFHRSDCLHVRGEGVHRPTRRLLAEARKAGLKNCQACQPDIDPEFI